MNSPSNHPNQLQHEASKLLIEAGYLCQHCHMTIEPRYKDDGTLYKACQKCLHNRSITQRARNWDNKPKGKQDGTD